MNDKKVLLIDRIDKLLDDKGEVIGRQIFDKGGDSVKVKTGRGGSLKKRWDELDNSIGKYINFTMGLYQNKYPFVEDFNEVKDTFEKQALAKVRDNLSDIKDKSVCLSYAKDLAVADRIKTVDILDWAGKFYQWLTTDSSLIREALQEGATIIQEKTKDAEVSEFTKEDLLKWVAGEKGWTQTETAKAWIINVCKIEASRIESEPKEVQQEIAELQGWKI